MCDIKISNTSTSEKPTGVENMGGGGQGGGSSKFDGESLSQYMRGKRGGLKIEVKYLKNTYEGLHLLVKLLAISLRVCNFTENKLLHTYFSRILARF